MSGPSLTVHPEHVSFCFLITALVAPPPAETGWGAGFDGPSAQRLLALFLLEQIQDTSSPTLPPLAQLLQALQQQLGAAGRALAGVLIACLQAIQTPDDMVSLAGRFGSFLAPPGAAPTEATGADSIAFISTSSPLGLFLRRVRLGLGNMSLQSLAALAVAVQQQVQDAVAQQQQLQQQQDEGGPAQTQPAAAASAAASSSSSSTGGALKEPAVLDAYLNTLLAAVKSLGTCLSAATIQAAAAPLSGLQDGSSSSSSSSSTKLQYLDLAVSMAHKDMAAALTALHHYFDCSGSSSLGGAGGGLGAAGIAAASSSSKSKGQHQSALHNLAALQASLGHPQEALAALQELLRLGQQQGDEWSLLHGLASLCRVMGASEGLQARGRAQHSGSAAAAAGGGGGADGSGDGSGSWAGWGLLDLRRTEQQLQLQALLQRCLHSARDMRVPHIAAYAAVALCRFRMTHASSSSSSGAAGGGGALESVTAVPGLSGDANSSAAAAAASAAAAGTSLAVQRMLLDVATLEHQAAIAASAPGTPAVAAAAAAGLSQQGQSQGAGLATRSTELYNPTEAFGLGTSNTPPGTTTAGAQPPRVVPAGPGWRSSAVAVTQALATGNVLAAAALQLQGASVLAGMRALMVLNGPGGAGVHDAAVTAAIPAAAAAAAGAGAAADPHEASAAAAKAAAAAAAASRSRQEVSAAALTGSAVQADDVAAGWVQLVQGVLELQGVAAAQHVLSLAEAHFPREPPPQLAVVREVVRLKAALQVGNFTDARLACEELQGLAPVAPQLGLELQLVAAEAHVQLLQASGCFAEAHAAAAALFATAAGAGMQPQAVGALLLMAKASLAAGDAAGGLPYALGAFLHAQVLQLDSLLPEAVLQVATAWQALAPPEDGLSFVLQLLRQVLPLAHAEGRLRVRAEMEAGIAKLELAALEDDVADGSSSSSVRQRLRAAAAMLQQAGEAKAAAGCWLLLAHACNAAGLEGERNEAAVMWHQCSAGIAGGGGVAVA